MPKDKKIKNPTQDEINLLSDKLARSLADYSNLEKRIESQRQLFITLATTSILSKMVEVLDDFYLAQNHLQDPGLKMAIDKFNSVLKTEGLEEINPQNLEFDPQSMECVQTVDGRENFVIEVRKLGYKLNGHLIRPAQVTVGMTDQK
ncbi:MAG: nucleotide exchange factor GrpE [Candidatus Shapirobacteria bacterium]|jgi:molecular chaperone GrpE (heat shock protein)|nr:nucleotide exchange factor GrpE [Candidatus Shapirobacteria bacterium]